MSGPILAKNKVEYGLDDGGVLERRLTQVGLYRCGIRWRANVSERRVERATSGRHSRGGGRRGRWRSKDALA